MRLGIDLDNTLADYSAPLQRLCRAYGVNSTDQDSKLALRGHLRRAGREDEWTRLQGELYGPLMEEARPFAGVEDFLARAAASGVACCVVSHRTRHPFAGPPHDLHASARQWLQRLGPLEIYLEETKASKLGRIGRLGIAAFIDDLPELLGDPGFPGGVRPVLFDPSRHHKGSWTGEACASWAEVERLFLP